MIWVASGSVCIVNRAELLDHAFGMKQWNLFRCAREIAVNKVSMEYTLDRDDRSERDKLTVSKLGSFLICLTTALYLSGRYCIVIIVG